MRATEAERKPRLWVGLFPLIAAAVAMAGVYAYYRFIESESPERVVIDVSAIQSATNSKKERPVSNSPGFSFTTYDEPRPLPRINFTDGDWQELTLESFRGRLILLNLWATWCGPCREEMPALDRLQSKLGGSDFQVVALAIDQEGIFSVKKFYEELGLESLNIYVDDSMRAASLLGAIGIPVTLLVDREGREIGRKLGPAEWDADEIIDLIDRYTNL